MRRKRTRIIIKENNKNEKKEKHTKYKNKKQKKDEQHYCGSVLYSNGIEITGTTSSSWK
jgi:hypothetical protein